MPILELIFFIADNLVKGSIKSCDIDSRGRNRFTEFISPCLLYTKKHSKRNQINIKPKAKAERFINIPANKQKEKNPIKLKK